MIKMSEIDPMLLKSLQEANIPLDLDELVAENMEEFNEMYVKPYEVEAQCFFPITNTNIIKKYKMK